MAVKQVTQINCDRCGKVVEGPPIANPLALAQPQTPLIYAEGTLLTEATKIHFVDLCAKCTSRVQTLLAQVRLDDSAKGDDGKPALGDNAAAASSQKPINPKADKSAPAKT